MTETRCFYCQSDGEVVLLGLWNGREYFLWRYKPGDLLAACAFVGLQVADAQLSLSQRDAEAVKQEMRTLAAPKCQRRATAHVVAKTGVLHSLLKFFGMGTQ